MIRLIKAVEEPEGSVNKALVSVKAMKEIIVEIVQIKISKEWIEMEQEKVGMVHLQEAI
jgi:uncharacterized membrane protein YqjE